MGYDLITNVYGILDVKDKKWEKMVTAFNSLIDAEFHKKEKLPTYLAEYLKPMVPDIQELFEQGVKLSMCERSIDIIYNETQVENRDLFTVNIDDIPKNIKAIVFENYHSY